MRETGVTLAVGGLSLAAAFAIVVQYIKQGRERKDGEINPLPWTLLPRPPFKSWLFGIAGDLLSAGRGVVPLLEQWAETCAEEPPCYAASLLGSPVAILYDLEEIRSLCEQRPHGFSMGRIGIPNAPLVLAEGEAWHSQRQAVCSALGQGMQPHVLKSLSRVANLVVSRLLNQRTGSSVNFISIVDATSRMFFLEAALDTQLDLLNCIEDTHHPLAVCVQDVLSSFSKLRRSPIQHQLSKMLPFSVARLLLPRFRRWALAHETLTSSCLKIASARRQRITSGSALPAPTPQPDILSSMLNVGEDALVASNLSFLFFAAGDTTASLVAWTTFHLAKSQDEYRFVREEALARSRHQDDRYIVSCSPRAEACVLEALRMNPPFDGPCNRMTATREFSLFNGRFALPKGTLVIPLYRKAVRRSMEASGQFSDLDRFQPDRWLTQGEDGRIRVDVEKKKKYTLAFGSGPRHCPGQDLAMTQAVMLLSEIARSFASVRFDPAWAGERGELVGEQLMLTMEPTNLRLLFESGFSL